jgi:hypothetical protein
VPFSVRSGLTRPALLFVAGYFSAISQASACVACQPGEYSALPGEYSSSFLSVLCFFLSLQMRKITDETSLVLFFVGFRKHALPAMQSGNGCE